MGRLIARGCVAAFLLLPALASAQQITRVEGTLVDGGTLTISGVAFGTKSVAAPVVWETFEDGQDGSQVGGQWDLNFMTIPPRYSSVHARDGLAAQFAFPEEQYRCSISHYQPNTFREIYIDGWYLYDAATPPSRNHKLFRLHTGWYAEPNLYLNVYCAGGAHLSQDLIPTDSVHSDKWFSWDWHNTVRTWVHIQGFFRASDGDTPNGQIVMWIDGVRWVDIPAAVTQPPGGTADWDLASFGNFLGHSADTACAASPGTSYTYWDDLYIDYTQARVELGNNINYALCTHREVQLPTQWGSESIGCRINMGSFSAQEAIYAFVVTSTGAVSAGFPASATWDGPGAPGKPIPE